MPIFMWIDWYDSQQICQLRDKEPWVLIIMCSVGYNEA